LSRVHDRFAKVSRKVSDAAGSPYAFLAALCLVLGWAATGPFFQWSQEHSLVINTITTCATFLMVFLIQSSQNRDTKAIQIKLNDLLCSIDKAHNELIDIENSTDKDMADARERVTANRDPP
jgi:low affinity Fe/Cu permease